MLIPDMKRGKLSRIRDVFEVFLKVSIVFYRISYSRTHQNLSIYRGLKKSQNFKIFLNET